MATIVGSLWRVTKRRMAGTEGFSEAQRKQHAWPFKVAVIMEVIRSSPPPADALDWRRSTDRNKVKPPKWLATQQIPVPSGEGGHDVPCHAMWLRSDDRATDADGSVFPAEGPVVFFVHGGAYVIQDTGNYYGMLGVLVKNMGKGATVFSVDYRLAPEHPYPAGLDDALAAYLWLVNVKGVAASRIVIAGDSAGGGLSAALSLRLRDDHPSYAAAGVAMLSPWVDLSGEASADSAKRNTEFDMLQPDRFTWNPAALYAGSHDLKHPLVSPLHSDLQGLPPLFITVGDLEEIMDEGVAFAKKAEAAGCTVNFREYSGGVHVFQMFGQWWPMAKTAVNDIAVFCNSVTKS